MQAEKKKATTPIITFPFRGIFMVIKIHPILMAMEGAIPSFVPAIILGYSRGGGGIRGIGNGQLAMVSKSISQLSMGNKKIGNTSNMLMVNSISEWKY